MVIMASGQNGKVAAYPVEVVTRHDTETVTTLHPLLVVNNAVEIHQKPNHAQLVHVLVSRALINDYYNLPFCQCSI